MKRSKYNILFEHKGGKFAFNSYTTSLNKIDDEFTYILDSIDSMSEEIKAKHSDLIAKMKQEGYIVDKSFDELKSLKFYNMSRKCNSDVLSLTILPTLDCNFACPYCYESCKKGTMSKEAEDKLVEFTEKKLKNKKILKVTWFGGEPLVAKERVYSLSEKLINLCEKMGIKYSAHMISNFYLADEETIKNLKKYKISQVQVTIDGGEKIHNERRRLKNSDEPTFERIINNIVKSKKLGLTIVIRINADKTNIDSLEELVDVLVKKGLTDVFVYLGHTVSFDEGVPAKFTEDCFLTDDFAKISADFTNMLANKGFKNNISYPKPISFHCAAQRLGSYIVGPQGELYKCEHDVGVKNKQIGNIFNYFDKKEINSSEYMEQINWLLSNPFEDEDCVNCNILPICMGGCSNYRNKLCKAYCMPFKYNLVELLKIKCDDYNECSNKKEFKSVQVC